LFILLGVADTSNGGEPIDGKERNRQRRQIYALMDPQKKEELLKKRRESYQRKKAKLQSTQSVIGTQESSGGPSALTQLESTPAVKGALNHMLGFCNL
jgi:sugar-specific transcriptional regulator TrmB